MEERPAPTTDGRHHPLRFAQAASKGLDTHQKQLVLNVYKTVCTVNVTEAKFDRCL